MADRASPTPWERLPAALGAALGARLEPTVEAVARSVSDLVPAFAEIQDPKFQRDVQGAVRAAVQRFVDLVGTSEPALPPTVREAFVALGAGEARDERGPDVLLTALRTASRALLRTASQVLADVHPLSPGGLLDLAEAVTAYTDEVVAATTDGYALQLREQASETDRRRRLLGELLLRGDAAENDVVSAAVGIGWRQVAAIVPVLLPAEHARDARFRFGAEGIVVDREQDAVLLVRDGPRASRARLVESLRGRGAVVAPTLAWPRTPQGVRLAERTAQLLGSRVGDDPSFVVDHLAALAVRGEPGAIGVLAELRLAPFADLAPGSRQRLLQTLLSWLRHWGSRAEVATELYIHPQTVSYRLRRLRELLGDDLDDPGSRLELLLVLVDHLGIEARDAVTGTAPAPGPAGVGAAAVTRP